MLTTVQFGGSDSSGSDDDNLPYPKPLTRASFLTPDFDPTTFLSSLHNRHQTLEDLRTELRTRSQELNKELLDLVNENYREFLSLGSSLHGGEEKVEEVRLGLLGFKRDVEGLKGQIKERKDEVEGLVEERKWIREEMQVGRALLEVDQSLNELEESLVIVSNKPTQNGDHDEDEAELSDSDDDSDEDGSGGMSISRLRRHMQQYIYIKRMIARIGLEHPFLKTREERVLRLRQTILLDLSSALKQISGTTEKEKERLVKVLAIYGDMGEPEEALRVLRDRKS